MRKPRKTSGFLKSCTACRGDVFWEEEIDGTQSLRCMQCGRTTTEEIVRKSYARDKATS